MDERIAARFWPKIDRQSDGCWVWTACKTREGYGLFSVKGRLKGAHRVAYELLVGVIPPGLHLDHLCRNRACVNPAHLEPVTCRENLLRGDTLQAKNVAKTQCPQGHPYDAENTRMKGGRRVCRACGRLENRKRIAERSKRRAAARVAAGLPPYVERRAAYRRAV